MKLFDVLLPRQTTESFVRMPFSGCRIERIILQYNSRHMQSAIRINAGNELFGSGSKDRVIRISVPFSTYINQCK